MSIYKKLKAHIEELSQISHLHSVHLRAYLRQFDLMIPKEWMSFNINEGKTLAINRLGQQKRKASLIFLTRVLKLRLAKDLAWSITEYVTPKSYLKICRKSIYKK